jgi:hypothetical protein
MSFLTSLSSLLDESSDESFEKKMNRGLDSIEKAIGSSVDKAEHGLKKIDNASKKIVAASNTVESTTEKLADSLTQSSETDR